jgi:hypothetical protein
MLTSSPSKNKKGKKQDIEVKEKKKGSKEVK